MTHAILRAFRGFGRWYLRLVILQQQKRKHRKRLTTKETSGSHTVHPM
jgi:hypothetical protein